MPAAGACSRAFQSLVDTHFDASIAPEGERRLRAHLETCEDCRGYYERHLVLGRIDPRAPPPAERLGAGLGLVSRARSGPSVAVWGGLAVAAAAAALVVLLPARARDGDESFRARGGTVAVDTPRLIVSRLGPGGVPLPLAPSARLASRSELAFAYTNPASFRYLLVFAVDEHGHVYWYYPAWLDPKDAPRAVAIEKSTAPRALGEAVRHDFDGRSLELLAAFGNEPLSVTDVEQRLARGHGPAAALSLPGFVVDRQHFELEP